jgi:Bacterial Ig-like domain (group 2)
MGIYVNNKLVYPTHGAKQIDTELSLSAGAQHTVVEEWDLCGGASYTTINITVSASLPTVTLTSNPGSIKSGSSSILTAAATNATQVIVTGTDGSNYTLPSTGGTQAVSPITTTTYTAVATGPQGTASAATAVTVTSSAITAIAVSPNPTNIAVGGTQQFTATATYSDGSVANVTSTATWTAANTAVATINSTGLATGVAAGATSVTASLNGVTGNVPLTVTVATATGVNIATWHGDNNRSGLNASEELLSPANVGPQTFGKLFSYLVDGYVYGQPLLISNVTVNGSSHNVLYAATERDSVYAFDADNYGSGAPLWKVSLLKAGETPQVSVVIKPTKGVTSTPVIDLASNTMYVVSEQTPKGHNSTFRLNALDITTGAQKFGGPVTIQASVPGTNKSSVNGVVSLSASCIQRAALLLANGTIYIGFGSCQSGWLLAYDATTLAQTGVFNASPNLNTSGTYGGSGGIWMGGGGPAADSAGNVYVTTGDGPWDGQTAWGQSLLKFDAQLQMEDYFTPFEHQYMECSDADLAAAGLLLIPGTSEAVAGGKTGKLYMVDTANPGREQANDAGATQTLFVEQDLVAPHSASCSDPSGKSAAEVGSYQIFGTAAYFNGSIYLGITPSSTSVPAGIRQLTYTAGTLTPGEQGSPSIQENSYGTTPFISANGTSDGILWMIDHGKPIQGVDSSNTATSATLRAYDANDLTVQLYNSGMNSGDVPGYGIKFTSPIVANGKVYIATGHDQMTVTMPQGELDVYGLK